MGSRHALPPLGLTLPQTAAMMGLSYQLLYKLRDRRTAISPAAALRCTSSPA